MLLSTPPAWHSNGFYQRSRMKISSQPNSDYIQSDRVIVQYSDSLRCRLSEYNSLQGKFLRLHSHYGDFDATFNFLIKYFLLSLKFFFLLHIYKQCISQIPKQNKNKKIYIFNK